MRDTLVFIFVLFACVVLIRHQIKSKVTYKHFLLFFILISAAMITYIADAMYMWIKFDLPLDYWLVLTLSAVLITSVFSLIRILKD
ncbi:hypothetical protein G3341_08610 [Providencia vermicola]|uniref:hypothetical protein n=1 Tax=Providencia TaxID=586 RepID=UPI0013A74080|nr:hypothetical protein [Providencia vermicola]QIC15736.1 hypothetical protein G3341_08610 [Providencia vermicola]